MAGRPWVLSEVTLGVSREIEYDVAVLPWGATEPHNLHLPFGTDSMEAQAVAIEAARIGWEAGARPIVLPTIPLGANAQQMGTPMTLNLSPSSQAIVLRDVVDSLEEHGVSKLLVLNGHGGNDFKAMIRELQPDTSVFLCASNWYQVVDPAGYFDEPGDHAGELETSVMQHIASDLVADLGSAGAGRAKVFGIAGLRDGTAWAPRDWSEVTGDTGVGDPSQATAPKGERFFQAVATRLADFLVDLAEADLQALYRDPDRL